MLEVGGTLVLERHGLDTFTPPPPRPRPQPRCARGRGVDRVVAVSSVGSLRTDWPVGTFVAPDDFFALGTAPSRYDDARGHSVPGFDVSWREQLLAAWTRGDEHPAPRRRRLRADAGSALRDARRGARARRGTPTSWA